jgi:hypothetical protein
MMRVRTNTAVSPDVAPTVTRGDVSAAPRAGAETHILDQVELSRLAATVPEDRSKKIAALKEVVASPGYLPPSLPVIRKLVSGSLSRAD